MVRSEILEVIEELFEKLCRKGEIVKVLDESGEPLIRKGQQVWKKMEGATAAERAFWNKENKVN
jgi:hypothetical protein